MSNTSATGIQVAANDPYDRPYRFAQPLNYLSQREQARVLILRGRLHEQPRAEHRVERHTSTRLKRRPQPIRTPEVS